MAEAPFHSILRADKTTGTAVSWALQSGPLLLILLGATQIGRAEVELLSDQPPQAVFGGGKRAIVLQWRNAAAEPAQADLRFRLYRASAVSMLPIDEARSWKVLSLSPGQTTLESLEIDLPQVRGEAAFVVAWFAGERKLGTTSIHAYPEHLLQPLITLAGERPIGLCDPEDRLSPAFKSVPSQVLKESEDIVSTEAALIIIAPMSSPNRPNGLATAVKRKAASGAAIIWIQPSPKRALERVLPTHLVREGSGLVVVTQASLVNNFSNSPLAQLNLVSLAELATGRVQLELPTDPQP